MFPEICYQFRYPKATAEPTVQHVSNNFVLTANLTSIITSNPDDLIQVPPDKVLLLQNFHIQAFSNVAAAYIKYVRVGYISNTAATIRWIASKQRILNTNTDVLSAFFQGELVIPQGHLYAQAVFSAADPANAIEVSATGVFIPRGNIDIA